MLGETGVSGYLTYKSANGLLVCCMLLVLTCVYISIQLDGTSLSIAETKKIQQNKQFKKISLAYKFPEK
ncbi:MAG: hypothetical protein E6Q37_10360 [Crocinitomicaceae bacterium]|nr:MAG: hypothetical protein E6Q37_10360 [Crocinitomicaceae bacterium]